jgi:hypothetical protein
MIENGKYKARATMGTLGKADTGTHQVLVDFEITDGQHKGQHIAWFGSFTDKTMDRTIESLRHCGWVGDDLDRLEGIDANEVELVIEQEEYEGKPRARVRWVNRIGSGATLKHPLTPAEARSFAQSMRGAVIAQRSKQPRQNSTPRRDDGDPGPEDNDRLF